MLYIVSSSKSLDFESSFNKNIATIPDFKKESEYLAGLCRKLSLREIKHLMSLSDKLGNLTCDRFEEFSSSNTPEKPAIFAYDGDVYEAINASDYGKDQMLFSSQKIRIVSGLYGLLRPTDLIKPYRLEMATKLENDKGNDLYKFWSPTLTKNVNELLSQEKEKILINLASNEYFKVIDLKNLRFPFINISFKEFSPKGFKTIALFAKKARGMMLDYVIRNLIDAPSQLKSFKEGGYRFEDSLSSENDYVFVR